MTTRNKLDQYLQKYLEVWEFRDYCPNGLVIQGKDEVKKGMTATSFNVESAQAAADAEVDFLLVHHPDGYFKGQSQLPVGRLHTKLKILMDAEISLFGFHLPLDAHGEVGNNIKLIEALGLEPEEGFLPEGRNKFIGRYGIADDWSVPTLIDKVEEALDSVNFAFLNGPDKIEKIAICSGGAPGDALEEAWRGGAQCLISGEAKENTKAISEELGMHFIAAGHHNTEIMGVRALGDHLADNFGLEILHLDVENPV